MARRIFGLIRTKKKKIYQTNSGSAGCCVEAGPQTLTMAGPRQTLNPASLLAHLLRAGAVAPACFFENNGEKSV